MKLPSVELRAEAIGNDSFELLNFVSLSAIASKAKQIEALRQDQKWLENHHNEISRRIDNLIQFIDGWPERVQDRHTQKEK